MREGTVLIVEDQDELARAYSTVLSTEYTVRTATSGSAALEMMDDTVDVVLLDRRMPGLSGDDVLDRIASEYDAVAVAMLTAVEPGDELVEMPLDEYVAKPIDNEELLALGTELFQRLEYDDQLREYFALVSKRLALERSDREPMAALEQLSNRLESLQADLDADLDAVGGPADPREREW